MYELLLKMSHLVFSESSSLETSGLGVPTENLKPHTDFRAYVTFSLPLVEICHL